MTLFYFILPNQNQKFHQTNIMIKSTDYKKKLRTEKFVKRNFLIEFEKKIINELFSLNNHQKILKGMKNHDIVFEFKRVQKKYDEIVELYNADIDVQNRLQIKIVSLQPKIKKFEKINMKQNKIINENKKMIKYLEQKIKRLKKKTLKKHKNSKNEIQQRRRTFRSLIRNIEKLNAFKSKLKPIKFFDPSVFTDEKNMNIVQGFMKMQKKFKNHSKQFALKQIKMNYIINGMNNKIFNHFESKIKNDSTNLFLNSKKMLDTFNNIFDDSNKIHTAANKFKNFQMKIKNFNEFGSQFQMHVIELNMPNAF